MPSNYNIKDFFAPYCGYLQSKLGRESIMKKNDDELQHCYSRSSLLSRMIKDDGHDPDQGQRYSMVKEDGQDSGQDSDQDEGQRCCSMIKEGGRDRGRGLGYYYASYLSSRIIKEDDDYDYDYDYDQGYYPRVIGGFRPFGPNECKQYTLKEMEEATNGFCNMIGKGEYGVVYHGILNDNNKTQIAVKYLLINRCTLKEFKGEVETMRRITHKNFVKLLGFCVEGKYRMLVYEYVDNSNLSYWLHQNTSKVSPLSWRRRMTIIQEVAKGLVYLHENSRLGLVHKHIKSSNILLDKHWNPKISDTRISSFLDYIWTYPMAPPMGMCGCSAPEYSDLKRNNAVVDCKSDVYSFGILLMEIVSRKPSVDRHHTEIEQDLVDWVKHMVSMEKYHEIVDPKLQENPAFTPMPSEVKRIIEIAIDCVNSNAKERPKMREVIQMLQNHPYSFLNYRDNLFTDLGFGRRSSYFPYYNQRHQEY